MENLNANDGTLDGAVAAMANFDMSNLVSFEEAANREAGLPPPEDMGRHRDREEQRRQDASRDPANGQFKAKDAAARGQEPAPLNGQPPPNDPAAIVAEDVSDGADEMIEFPAETEGGEPVRRPLAEVVAEAREAATLKAELEQVRRVAPPPVQWDQQMYQTAQARHQLVQMLDTISQTMLPPEPDVSLINPQNPYQDPAAFYQQKANYDAARQRLQQVHQAREHHNSLLSQERNAITEVARLREQERLREFWPEIKSSAVQRQVMSDAARHYGITEQDFAQMLDSRHYAVLKDALAHRAGQAQRQAAVKVVRQAPRLVKSSARPTQNRGQQTYSSSMQRLQQTGHIDDAANAIGGLLR